MTVPEKLLFVCINSRLPGAKESCGREHASEDLLRALKDGVKKRGLKPQIRVTRTGCLGVCHDGPHAYLAPEGRWFHAFGMEDVENILEGLEA